GLQERFRISDRPGHGTYRKLGARSGDLFCGEASMRRLSLAAFILMIPFMLQLTTGCGGKGKTTGGGGGGASTEGKGGGDSDEGDTARKELETKGSGTLKGKVTFEGPLPKDYNEDIKELVNKQDCHDSPKPEKVNQSWFISKDKGVRYVVVWVS